MSTVNLEDANTRIVWISDIHLRSGYKGSCDKKLKSFIDAFLFKLESEINLSKPVHYFFITGDIAFSGHRVDYDFFWEWFIVPLHSLYARLKKENPNITFPKFITIPGNHDISWDSTAQFSSLLNSFNSQKKYFHQQNELLKDNSEQSFYKSFENYTNAFTNRDSTYQNKNLEIWNDFFCLDSFPESSYKERRLFGHLVDFNRKLIIVLINTAWFSIGEKFNDLLVENFLSKYPPPKKIFRCFLNRMYLPGVNKHYVNQTKKILEIKDKIVEYGNQITGREIFDTDKLEEVVRANPDFTVITCMHHPVNWLSWGEIYDYGEESTKANEFSLNIILDNTDILLTGHEHVPVDKMPERIDKDGKIKWHIKAGMFLEDQIDVKQNEPYFEHSRFSIVDIYPNNIPPKFQEKRFLLKKQGRKYEWHHISKKDYPNNENSYSFEMRLKKGLLNEINKSDIISNLKHFDISSFLNLRYNISGVTAFNPIILKDTTGYKIFKAETDKEIRYCILPLTVKFAEEFLPASNRLSEKYFIDIDIMKKVHPPDKPEKVHIIWPDILINNRLSNKYMNSEENHLIIFTEISQYCNMLFNKFRHLYFGRFDSQEKPLLPFERVQNVSFIIEPLPFWIVKRYCNLNNHNSVSNAKS